MTRGGLLPPGFRARPPDHGRVKAALFAVVFLLNPVDSVDSNERDRFKDRLDGRVQGARGGSAVLDREPPLRFPDAAVRLLLGLSSFRPRRFRRKSTAPSAALRSVLPVFYTLAGADQPGRGCVAPAGDPASRGRALRESPAASMVFDGAFFFGVGPDCEAEAGFLRAEGAGGLAESRAFSEPKREGEISKSGGGLFFL